MRKAACHLRSAETPHCRSDHQKTAIQQHTPKTISSLLLAMLDPDGSSRMSTRTSRTAAAAVLTFQFRSAAVKTRASASARRTKPWTVKGGTMFMSAAAAVSAISRREMQLPTCSACKFIKSEMFRLVIDAECA